jgi:hypothetical protein
VGATRRAEEHRLDRLPEEWKVLRDFDPKTISDFTEENEKHENGAG